MNKSIILVFFCIFICSILLIPQDKEIREDVTVTNIEIPLRVIHKKNPVSGLKKSDFKLFVNGKEKEIHGFYEEIRRIKIEESTFEVDEKKPDPRLFVLVFNIVSFHTDMTKGVDYFFDRILRKNDRLMALVNSVFIKEQVVADPILLKKKIKRIIKEESKTAEIRLNKVLVELDDSLRRLRFEINSIHRLGNLAMSAIERLQRYLHKHLDYFRRYKREFLVPDINKYYNFAKFLDKRKGEKWIINFYQLEKFPKFRRMSSFMKEVEKLIAEGMSSVLVSEQNIPAQKTQKLLWEIEKEMNVADDFPVDQIKKLFLQVNTTFHTILMKSREISDSEHFDVKAISTDIENSLRDITKVTGGELLLSNNLEASLKTVSEKKDIFYVLSYSPENKKEMNGKIRIELPGKHYSIRYNKNVYEDFFRHFLKKQKLKRKEILISNTKFENFALSFEISDFKTKTINKNSIGVVEIRIQIFDSKSKSLFDQKKRLQIKEKKTKLSIKFKKLPKGEYNAIINVTDLINGTKYEDYKKILIK